VKTDNLILIKGGSYNDIKKALRQWIDLYSKDLQDGLIFQLYKNGSGNHIIQADERLDNERFYYLVNYLNYPEGIEYEIDIEGYTTGKDKNKLKNKKLLVYISPTDKEFDNVFVTTSENENFKIDFGGRITEGRERKNYSYPTNLNLGLSESITVRNKQDLNKQTERPTVNLENRFKIISSIIFSAFVMTFFLFQTEDNFLTINYVIAFSVWGWLTFDYKILQVDKLYFSSVGLGLAIFLYGLFLNEKFDENVPMIQSVTTMPIFLLVIQRPLRLAYIRVMKREPVVEKPAPSFADFVYIFILWMITLTIPAIYFKG
jgi:hypothetical protein